MPEVVIAELLGADGAGQEPAAQRRVWHEANAEFSRGRDDVALNVPAPNGPLALHGGDRVDRVGFPQLFGCHLGQPEMPDLPGTDKLRHGLHGFHNRNAEVTAVHVIEVDDVGTQAAEARFRRLGHICGVAPDIRVAVPRIANDSELCGQLNLVAAFLQ